ncbi:MAG: hypothetical protein ACFFA4_15065 [Promethearchaeota archaeon]
MNNKDIDDDELEEELEEAFKNDEKKRDIFRIIRNEKEALDTKEERIKKKFRN